jgi:hypothetical protein
VLRIHPAGEARPEITALVRPPTRATRRNPHPPPHPFRLERVAGTQPCRPARELRDPFRRSPERSGGARLARVHMLDTGPAASTALLAVNDGGPIDEAPGRSPDESSNEVPRPAGTGLGRGGERGLRGLHRCEVHTQRQDAPGVLQCLRPSVPRPCGPAALRRCGAASLANTPRRHFAAVPAAVPAAASAAVPATMRGADPTGRLRARARIPPASTSHRR